MNVALFGTSADPPSIGHQQILQWLEIAQLFGYQTTHSKLIKQV
nr:hypothetical protein [Pseudanabaena sp. Chao 1811]